MDDHFLLDRTEIRERGLTLTRAQEGLLLGIANAPYDDVSGAKVADGFYRLNYLIGRFKTPTAEVLERQGLVETGYDARLGMTTVKLTDAGRACVKRYSETLPLWRVEFMGGQSTDVRALTSERARRGPWNPSFGGILNVVPVEAT